MKASSFDFIGNLDTLIAVIIGAFLATGGALVADIIQDRLGRKRRARDAARFFGEVLFSLDQLIAFALQSLELGTNRWGSVTQRLFRTALQEASVYERNRERVFDIKDIALRQRLHRHMLSTTIPLVALIEYCEDLEALDGASGQANVARRTEFEGNRDGALDAIVEQRAETAALITALERIAKVKIVQLEPIDGPAPADTDGSATTARPSDRPLP